MGRVNQKAIRIGEEFWNFIDENFKVNDIQTEYDQKENRLRIKIDYESK